MLRLFMGARLLLVLSFLLPLISGALLVARYDDVPDPYPVHYGITGQPDKFVPKTMFRVLAPLLPAVAFPLLCLVFLNGWIPTDSNSASSGRVAGRQFLEKTLPWLSLLLTLVFCLVALGSLNLIVVPWWTVAAVAASAAVFGIWAFQHASQLAGPQGHAGNANSWFGSVYHNPGDKSLIVERRDGLGLTVNFANPLAYVLVIVVAAFFLLRVC